MVELTELFHEPIGQEGSDYMEDGSVALFALRMLMLKHNISVPELLQLLVRLEKERDELKRKMGK